MTGKLLDTTVLIDLSRGDTEAADLVDAAFKSETPLFISVISATAIAQGLELATDKVRHFKMVPDLVVKRPY